MFILRHPATDCPRVVEPLVQALVRLRANPATLCGTNSGHAGKPLKYIV